MRITDSYANNYDFCSRHAPGPALAAKRYDTGKPDGPDGRGNCFSYDTEHPDYDGEHLCHTCRCVLTEQDEVRS